MTFFGPDLRNGLPIGLGSVAGFGIAPQFSPASLFLGGTVQGAWFDPSDATTLFSDRAGTTPCGTPGGGSVVPVGAMLDKRAAGYSVFFAGAGERYSVPASSAFAYGTGAFTVEAWIYATAIDDRFAYSQTVNAQNYFGINVGPTGTVRFIFGVGGGTTISTSASTITTNTWYHIAVVREGAGTNETKIYVNGVQQAVGTCSFDFTNTTYNPTVGGYTHATGNAFSGYISNLRVVKGTAVYSGAFTPSGPLTAISGTSLLTAGIAWSGNPAFTNAGARVDGLNPFTASPVGNHAIAANDTTARPELRARVNLLTYSEQFDNAAWTKTNVTITANAAIAPDGTTTADLAYPTTTGANRTVYQPGPGTTAVSTVSFYAKASGKSWIWVVGPIGSSSSGVYFNVSAGTVGTQFSGYTGTIASVGNGWYRCVVSAPSAAMSFGQFTIVDADNTNSITANGTDGILIWGAQLIPTNEFPANTYQRISDANTYDAVGFPKYLYFDGVDDRMTSTVDLSGTNKATVFLSLRKLSDAAYRVPVVHGIPGAYFAILAPYADTQANYAAQSRGTVLDNQVGALTRPAPRTDVLTMQTDIGAPALSLRTNGTTYISSTASQGTGNFTSGTLDLGYIGPLGRWLGPIYSLIVVGSAVSAGQISATEQWVAQRTGIVL